MEYNNSLWISTYKSNEQLWLIDSLNWEKTSNLITADWSILSSLFNNSFVSHHILTDYKTNLSLIDLILINSSSIESSKAQLYNSYIYDIELLINQYANYVVNLLQLEFQNVFTINTLLNNDFTLFYYEYINTYFFNSYYKFKPSVIYDSYLNNMNFFTSNGILNFYLFFFFIWVLIYLFITNLFLKWHVFYNFFSVRLFYYFYSFSKETRIQFEVVFQTVVFIIFYWSMVLMTFDDDQEEVIEFVDTSLFQIFTIIILYLIYKYSIHYFAFLDASVSGRRTVNFITAQFFTDFLNTFSLILRFFILLFRINVYDTLEDFFDTYYIFVGDFDDDEYLNELFLSIHGTLYFTFDNQDDRSFLFEDENDFFYDFYFLYFVVWGKLFYFMFFMVEEGGRLGLAFYICYLIIFEVHAVNSSYCEDNYISKKRLPSSLN
uniref:Uncharacterized protein n=1 Tax=Strombidium cf. sulcatum TaxID=2793073 RepID=A0A7T0Q555_9SPIT|nr:hypothetical protein J6674_mgp24 [Strombidium cf. sulcatum]QPL15965.1 hypothetical protein [Strombidium cf. sulcatum]